LRELSPEQFAKVAIVLLIYAVLSYALHLFGDLQSFRSWVREGKVGKDGIEQLGRVETIFQATKTQIERLGTAHKRLNDELEKQLAKTGNGISSSELSSFRNMSSGVKADLDRAAYLFSDVQLGFDRVQWIGKLTLVGWYGLVPLTISVAAFFSMSWSLDWIRIEC